jgi:predicted transcriptional regulator
MASFGKIEPLVPIERSVFPDRIVCLECGMPFKMIKRHLQSEHGLTVDGYRRRFNLPPDYPSVATEYLKMRARLARTMSRRRASSANSLAQRWMRD